MKVVILCGGKGIRLHQETEYRPKSLVNIGDMPVLWHVMKTYSHYGYRDFILCLGYKGEMIKNYFLNFDEVSNDFTLNIGSGEKSVEYHKKNKLMDDWKISFVDTGLESNTGARVAKIKDHIGDDEDFFLTYTDGVADVNIKETLKYHKKKGKIVTLSGVSHINPFGIIEPKDGLVKVFKEKPKSQKTFINGGFYVFNKKIFDYLNTKDDCVLERKPMEKLSSMDEVAIYEHGGFWYCMDHMKHLEELKEMYAQGKRPWMVWDASANKKGGKVKTSKKGLDRHAQL